MNPEMFDMGTWIRPFGDVFLGVERDGRIQHVVGDATMMLAVPAEQVVGMSWADFVERHADSIAREGLLAAWQAMMEGYVAAEHWAVFLPFKTGVVCRLRLLDDTARGPLAVHLSVGEECNLDAMVSTQMLDAVDRLVRLSQQVFRGQVGPLTDAQVKEVGTILSHADYMQQMLTDMRAEMWMPSTLPPLPQALADLLTFAERDFRERRVTTHRLGIDYAWSAVEVYCHADLRGVVKQILQTLFLAVTAETQVTLTDSGERFDDTVRVTIRYHSDELELRVNRYVEPLALSDPGRLRALTPLQRLVTSAHACLKPVAGRAWAEPDEGDDATAAIVLVLPRWRTLKK